MKRILEEIIGKRSLMVLVFLMLLGLLWGGSSWAQDPWTQTGNMVQARAGHTATPLANGVGDIQN